MESRLMCAHKHFTTESKLKQILALFLRIAYIHGEMVY